MASATDVAPATNGTSSAPSAGPVLPPLLFATLVKAENQHGIDNGTNRYIYEVKREAGSDFPGAGIFWQVDVPYIVGSHFPPRYTYAVVIDVNPTITEDGWTLVKLDPTPEGSAAASAQLIKFLLSLSTFIVLHVEQGNSKPGLPLVTRVTIQLDGVLWQVVTEGFLLPIAPGVTSIKKITKFVRDPGFPNDLKPTDAGAVLPVAVAECAIENAVNESKTQASA